MSSKYLLDYSMKVQKLPSNVRSKLQSGLIVTGVTQCVLELVENSLDAEATAIAVRIKLSKYEIEVLDNGVGISKNNLDLIGNRFMTSKCHEANDLNKTSFTYGFRGQALASLLDLCQTLTIKTKSEKNNSILTKVFKKGKSTTFDVDYKEKSDTGTTVIVSDFMFSMPIRRKRIAEAFDLNEVKTQLEYLAIIHNKVCFTLRDEDKGVVLLQTKKNSDVRISFADLFGFSIHRCLSVYHKEENYEINGFICLNRHSENNLQLIYVNKRIVFKSLVHKFINCLIDKYFEGNRNLANETAILQGFSSNIPKGQHNVYLIQIHCPNNYFEFFSNFRKRTVEFSNWNDVFKVIRNGISKVLNFLKNGINNEEYISLEGVNLTNLRNTLLPSQPKTIASFNFTKKKHCNRKSSRVYLKNYVNDSFEVEIQKNRCFCSVQKKLIANDIKKLFLKMITMKPHKINAIKSILLKNRKVIKFPSKFTIFKKFVLKMLKIKDLNYLPTVKKKNSKKFKLLLIMCFINFAVFLISEAKNNLNVFKHYNEVVEQNISKVFALSNVEKLLSMHKSITDIFFKGKDKLKSMKNNLCVNKFDLGKKDEIYCNNMLITDTSWEDKSTYSKNINYICPERKNEISRKTNAKLSVKGLFHECVKDSVKSSNIISNVEKLNKLNKKNKKGFYEADGPSKFFPQRNILSSHICSNMKFFQRVELSFGAISDSGYKLISNRDEITTKSLLSHCRNRNSFITNINSNLRTISETIGLNGMIRKRKKKINYLNRKKLSKQLMMMLFKLFNILKFNRSLKSSFKHLFRRKMRFFDLLKDAHMQAKILKSKNKKVQTMPVAFPLEKSDIAVRSNGKDIRLLTCENIDTENRFLGYENEVRKKKEIESNYLNEKVNLIEPTEGMKRMGNDCTYVKDVPPSSYDSFNTIQSTITSKLSKSRTLFEASNIFPKTKMLDSSNLYELIASDKETFNLNSALQTAQTLDHSMSTTSTKEIDILSEIITKSLTPHGLNVSENTQNIAETSDKNVSGSKENKSEKFISNDLPITTVESNKLTNIKNRFTVSERYSFIPKNLSQMMYDKSSGFLNDKHSLILINWNRQLFKGNYCKLGSNYMNIFESKNKSFRNNTGSFSNSAFEVNIVRDIYLKSEKNLVYYENHVIKAELSKPALKVHSLSNSFAITKDILQNLKIIGQWDRKFIVATMGISNPYKMQILTIFDQHAVDERIQLEKLMQEFRTSDGKIISSNCNPPIKCVLSRSDVRFIPFLKSRLMEFGVEVSVLDSQTIKFYKIPLCLIEKEEENTNAGKVINLLRSLIIDIIQEFIETRGTVSSIPKVLYNIISMKACKKAIKFNQALSLEAMNKTIIELFECEFPFQCAHGRPTIIPVLDVLDLTNMEEKQKLKLNFKQFGAMKTQI